MLSFRSTRNGGGLRGSCWTVAQSELMYIDVRLCAGNVEEFKRRRVVKSPPQVPGTAAVRFVPPTGILDKHGLCSAHRACEEESSIRSSLGLDNNLGSCQVIGLSALRTRAYEIQSRTFGWPRRHRRLSILATGGDAADGSPCLCTPRMSRVADPLDRFFGPANVEVGDHIFGSWNMHAIGAVVGCHLKGSCHKVGSRANAA
jgi:hypothetical protein